MFCTGASLKVILLLGRQKRIQKIEKNNIKERMGNEVNVCPSKRAPICYNIYDRNDYEKLLEKKMAHFWIVQQSCGDEYFEALKVSERIL